MTPLVRSQCVRGSNRRRFLRHSLFVVTGASGCGKSAVCSRLAGRAGDVVVFESDVLWYPEFAGNRYRELCLRVAKTIGQSGRPVLLCGSASPGEFEACVEARYFASFHYLALVCDEDVLSARLRARPAWRQSGDDEFVARHVAWNRWFRETPHSADLVMVDTSSMSVVETVGRAAEWLASTDGGRGLVSGCVAGKLGLAADRTTPLRWSCSAERGAIMKPRIEVVTLGVDDLERSLSFYRHGLGLPTQGIVGTEFEDGAVVFFNMNDDLILALYPRTALAKDAKVSVSPPSPSAISIGHIVGSQAEVDAIMQQAQDAGAHVTDPARERFWGAILDTSKILMATYGKSPGIQRGRLRNRGRRHAPGPLTRQYRGFIHRTLQRTQILSDPCWSRSAWRWQFRTHDVPAMFPKVLVDKVFSYPGSPKT